MRNPQKSGRVRRMAAALGRWLLGKTSHEYMKQFTGTNAYFDRAIAAQLGWPLKRPAKLESKKLGASESAAHSCVPAVGDPDCRPADPDYELVHGWPKAQLGNYLKRNPAYRPAYDAQARIALAAAHPKRQNFIEENQ